MKKENIRAGIVLAVLLVLYNLIVFIVPIHRTGVFWASYIFTIVSFAIASVAIYIGFVKQPDAKSKFYGFPILKIAAIYALVQLLGGFVFMLLGTWIPVWIPVILYAVLAGAAVVGLVSVDAVVEQIQVQDTKLKKDVSMMRGLQSKVIQMANQCEDPDATKSVRSLADALRYSDPVSSDAIAEAERDLSAAVDELQQAVVDGDGEAIKQLCSRAKALLDERNRLCKLNKN